jgi:alpha-glucosidase (family GH31 glycosyl hydrolase)
MSKIKPQINPVAASQATVISDQVRFTVLTNRLIRMELDPAAGFEDRASLTYWYRQQPVPDFSVKRSDGWLTIETDALVLHFYENNRFHWRDLWIELKKTCQQWRYGDQDFSNLGGTIRTLDSTRGPIPLDDGVVSRSGWAIVDDSQTLVLDDNQWPAVREKSIAYKDLYFYGYGQDYLAAIQDHQLISGKPNLLPRWSLGNWWSRYWAYSSDELLTLMDTFKQQQVPLSVCIVDMDWHKTKTGNASSGWTGYSWNRELFPDPEGFISELHQKNLKTALNLHPAEGIHNHEDQYPIMATRMGIDPTSGQPILFEIADPHFARAYFEVLHHPLEEQGVDFWWLDWQQGSRSKIAGLDPLFWLNHLHYYDQGKSHVKRPFIFSRWPGLGGQRYPIGFSGDTVVDWSTLNFQPEMTATASNVAYGWWSHDIGGHCEGVEDAELYLRWVQFGIFSPIFRLHSTNNEFIDRLPWSYGLDIFQHARFAMQFRHQLIPFIYTANERNARTGEPLVLPIYYSHPNNEESYTCPNQYTFGQSLLVAPVTSPSDHQTGFARKTVWLPKGNWTNFFTNESFEGGFWYSLYLDKADIPVFVPDGTIIPLNADPVANGADLPQQFKVKVFAGYQGEFDLYEDGGEGQAYLDGEFCHTLLTHSLHQDTLHIVKHPARGEFASQLPGGRTWQFDISNISDPLKIEVSLDGQSTEVKYYYDEKLRVLSIKAIACPNPSKLEITLDGFSMERFETSPVERVERMIRMAKIPSLLKQQLMRRLPELAINPLSLFEIAHTLTKSQMLSFFESLFYSNAEKPAEDLDYAFERMMVNLRKLGTG